MSEDSRAGLRWAYASLPWEMLSRPIMLTLTYPAGEWREFVADAAMLERHRRAFIEAWFRRWGERMMGVWAKEFQERGAPHVHFQVQLPAGVADIDYAGLQHRTKVRNDIDRRYGKSGRRVHMQGMAIGGKYGGEFGMWARDTWANIVGAAAGSAPRSGGISSEGVILSGPCCSW